MTEKAYESVTFGEAVTGVLEIPKVAIEGIWRFSEMSTDITAQEEVFVRGGLDTEAGSWYLKKEKGGACL
ncbi:hypothetical protein PCC9214_02900 [Planktothrix tepida]|uniref:hypothetical protein n=1 Tax=Planktothrix tepida TaxID=1678309 RepID=UPI0020B1BE29|nr:hypothetical protein [Planktothrix tepida]CAD5956509.1 hypothetical protein PCC9214_02900 [Planktothrix tepida]